MSKPERYPLDQLDQYLSKINEYGRAGATETELRKIAGSAANMRRWVKAMTEDGFIRAGTDAAGRPRYWKTEEEGEEMARDLRTNRGLWKLNRYLGRRLRPKGYLSPYFQMLREKLGRGPVDNERNPKPTSQIPPFLDEALDVAPFSSSDSPQ